jgi:hypothetical protein
MKNSTHAIDNQPRRNNFTKLSARNFQLTVLPIEAGIGSVIDSAVSIVCSDNRFAGINKRKYSLTFLKGFEDVNMADHIMANVCTRINLAHPEARASWEFSVNKEENSTLINVVIKTNLING